MPDFGLGDHFKFKEEIPKNNGNWSLLLETIIGKGNNERVQNIIKRINEDKAIKHASNHDQNTENFIRAIISQKQSDHRNTYFENMYKNYLNETKKDIFLLPDDLDNLDQNNIGYNHDHPYKRKKPKLSSKQLDIQKKFQNITDQMKKNIITLNEFKKNAKSMSPEPPAIRQMTFINNLGPKSTQNSGEFFTTT